MKKCGFFKGVKILLLVAFSVCFFVGNSQVIKLMSYNIGSSNWTGNRDSVVARIYANNPDVICALEATGNMLDFLSTALAEYQMLETFGNQPEIAESHIYYRKNMFQVVDSGFVEMEMHKGYNGSTRYIDWVKLKEVSSGNQFYVYASHFTHLFNRDSAVVAQYRNANNLVQLMASHSSFDIPMFSGADFNADSTKAVMDFLLNSESLNYSNTIVTNPIELFDTWYLANPNVKKTGTGAGSNTAAIDWILTNGKAEVLSATIDGGGVKNGQYPSDHQPLVVTFELSSVTGGNNEFLSDFDVYPNPVKKYLNVTTSNDVSNTKTLMILFDVIGVEVFRDEIKSRENLFDLESLKSGIYSCHFIKDDKLLKADKVVIY